MAEQAVRKGGEANGDNDRGQGDADSHSQEQLGRPGRPPADLSQTNDRPGAIETNCSLYLALQSRRRPPPWPTSGRATTRWRLYLDLDVEEAGGFSVDAGGLEVSTGRDNLVVRAFEALHPADGIAFRVCAARSRWRGVSAPVPRRLGRNPPDARPARLGDGRPRGEAGVTEAGRRRPPRRGIRQTHLDYVMMGPPDQGHRVEGGPTWPSRKRPTWVPPGSQRRSGISWQASIPNAPAILMTVSRRGIRLPSSSLPTPERCIPQRSASSS
jgi:hypothetical protein